MAAIGKTSGGVFRETFRQTGAGMALGGRAIGSGLKNGLTAAPVGAAKAVKDVVTMHPIRAIGDIGTAVGKTLGAPLSVAGGAFQVVESAASVPVKALKNGALGQPGVVVGKVAGGVYDAFVGGMVKDLAEGNGKQKLAGLMQGAMFMMPIGAGAKGVDGLVMLAKSAVGKGEGSEQALKLLSEFAQGKQEFGNLKVRTSLWNSVRHGTSAMTEAGLTKKRGEILDGTVSVEEAVRAHLDKTFGPAEFEAAKKNKLTNFATREEHIAAKTAEVVRPQNSSGFLSEATQKVGQAFGKGAESGANVVQESEDARRMRIAKFVTEKDYLTLPAALSAGAKMGTGEIGRQMVPQMLGTKLQHSGDKTAAAEKATVAPGKTPLPFTAIQSSVAEKATGTGGPQAAGGALAGEVRSETATTLPTAGSSPAA